MNKNAIKNFATEARRELISRVGQRALKYGISDQEVGNPNDDSVGGHLLSSTEKKQRAALIAQIKEKGYEQVMEEVAYTWFNRFSALRFMEVNEYLPSRVRVFTDENNAFKPQILTEAIHLDLEGLDMEKVYAYKEANDNDELYKYLLITQCNALNSVLPGMFQKIADYTELLFPDNLLREGSVVQQMIELIPEEDWEDAVQIIGWLYQYYISEKHDEIVNVYKGTVKKEDIPAATQLFTTDWVVRYIVDNTVGRYWIEHNPSSKLKDELDFYVTSSGGDFANEVRDITPEEVTVLDPCVGSGHFSVYAFDVLLKIYTEFGYTERDAVASIVQNNLFGLDIDDRAAQLSYFSVMMKARQYDRRFFNRHIQPNFISLQETNEFPDYLIDYFAEDDANLRNDIISIIRDMENAKEYGSLIKISEVNFNALFSRMEELESDIRIEKFELESRLLPLLKQAKILSKKYAVVATNPPYLNKYNDSLKKFVNDNYKDYAADLFSVFIYRNFDLCIENGYSGMMTPFVWLSIKSHFKLREYIVQSKSITTLIQMEYSAYEEATVPICAFVLKNALPNVNGVYFDLSDFVGGMDVQKEKILEAIANPNCDYVYETNQENFHRIPSTPITAYWVSEDLIKLYSHPLIGSRFAAKEGVGTRNDDVFLKMHWEVSRDNVSKQKRWILTDKAGGYRKWYLGSTYVMDWEDDGHRIKNYRNEDGSLRSRPQNTQYLFKPGISWGKIGSGASSFRFRDAGYGFNDAAPTLFGENPFPLLAALNTNIYKLLLKIRGGTLNMTCGVIEELPILGYDTKELEGCLIPIVKENINISQEEWNSYETAWDFQRHPLMPTVMGQTQLSAIFDEWKQHTEQRFATMQKNEEELNRIFIDYYGLQNELSPEIERKNISLRVADLENDIKSLISYSVGCMFGRYSLDKAGIAYAGGEWDNSKYSVFPADKDNIIPISNDEYFEDDIVARFVEFIEIVYGKETLQDNLRFIAEAIGGNGLPKDIIRNYFMNDFYKDHCKIYQKRPIYWLFDSGKKNGFKALIYMHRYQPDTLARIRTDYVHEQQARYRTAIADLETRIANASTSERVKLNKQLKTLNDQATEIHAYEEKIHHLADQMISIDLDDGVKKNYEIFKDVLAKIK